MTYILTVCLAFNTWIDTCGLTIKAEFRTDAECKAALNDFKGQPVFSYGYCGMKEKK